MMKRIGAAFILCIMILSMLSGCNNQKTPVDTGLTTETQTPETKPEPITEDPDTRELRIMSFNIHNSLPAENGVLTETSQNRLNAVKAEIQTYSPDLLGLQEDISAWTDNLHLEGYTPIYDPEVSGSFKHCAIYFKSELTCMEYGWQWLTSDGSKATVALTVADILAGGKYEMTAEELARLDITSSTEDSFLRNGITYYYRLSSPYDDQLFTAWQFVSKDKMQSLVCVIMQDISILDKNCYVHLRGLESGSLYKVKQSGQLLSGAALRNIGLLLEHTQPQYSAFVFEIRKVSLRM